MIKVFFQLCEVATLVIIYKKNSPNVITYPKINKKLIIMLYFSAFFSHKKIYINYTQLFMPKNMLFLMCWMNHCIYITWMLVFVQEYIVVGLTLHGIQKIITYLSLGGCVLVVQMVANGIFLKCN
jgi:hypothetical protein